MACLSSYIDIKKTQKSEKYFEKNGISKVKKSCQLWLLEWLHNKAKWSSAKEDKFVVTMKIPSLVTIGIEEIIIVNPSITQLVKLLVSDKKVVSSNLHPTWCSRSMDSFLWRYFSSIHIDISPWCLMHLAFQLAARWRSFRWLKH